MTFSDHILPLPRPDSIFQGVRLPRRQNYFASPQDWRDQVLYFLLVDRFSDGGEAGRPLLDRTRLDTARPPLPNGEVWRWDRWAASGAERWQGGTLQGVASKLDYLAGLGVTALWLSPVFKQRGHLDTYHGYGIQDFLEIDPRFGSRGDLVALVAAAHQRGMRIILDIIFNHSGPNWIYPNGEWQPAYKAFPTQYAFGHWLDEHGQATADITSPEQGVWPRELQQTECYTRAGCGDLGAGDINDPTAEHKRTDFLVLRDFNLSRASSLNDLAQCYKYWIALTDCDGFRIDTLKHVALEEARNFCGSIKEFATNLNKQDFLLVGEIAGGDNNQHRYLDVLSRNLNAALDIGEMRLILNGVAKGLQQPRLYFNGFSSSTDMGSHRQFGERHVSILDDHDHVFGEKIRFSSEAASAHQVTAAVALQLFSLGIPCIYYGTEQALAGPEPAQRSWLPGWKSSDRYLREAMFGPRHPRQAGRAGVPEGVDGAVDDQLPGFGPFGSAGQHCFDQSHPVYRRITAMAALRTAYPALRQGRQYQRPIRFLGYPLDYYGNGEIIAWSRILDDEELLCVLNPHGLELRGADILIDTTLNPIGQSLRVILNTAAYALVDPATYSGSHPLGSSVEIQRLADGTALVAIRNLAASELIILSNHPQADVGGIVQLP